MRVGLLECAVGSKVMAGTFLHSCSDAERSVNTCSEEHCTHRIHGGILKGTFL